MSRDVDPLLERINGVLAECDASDLPPLTSEPAAAALDLMGQAGFEPTPWQESVVRQLCADLPVDQPRSRWRRWWSR